MKIKYINIVLFALIILSSFSCKKLKTPDAVSEREEWIKSFSDSIQDCERTIETAEIQLGELNNNIESMLKDFEYFSNPKAVEGFYILKDWQKKIPMTKSGIYARLTEQNSLELIATLSGGEFDQISVSSDGEELKSAVVKYDQALNYRYNNLNTVCFSGGACDSIAELIYGYKGSKIKLDFLNGKSPKHIDIPGDEKEMIAKTWELYDAQREVRKLEKDIWVSSKKIDTYRTMLDNNQNSSNNQ